MLQLQQALEAICPRQEHWYNHLYVFWKALLICVHLLTVQSNILLSLVGSVFRSYIELSFLAIGHPRDLRPAFCWVSKSQWGQWQWFCWPDFPAVPHNLSHRLQLSFLPNLCSQLGMINKRLLNFTNTKNFPVMVLNSWSWTLVGVN